MVLIVTDTAPFLYNLFWGAWHHPKPAVAEASNHRYSSVFVDTELYFGNDTPPQNRLWQEGLGIDIFARKTKSFKTYKMKANKNSKRLPMKTQKLSSPKKHLAPDSQKRLLAYSTAAGLGAFFAGQNAEATLVQAPGLAPYPHVFLPQPLGSTNATDLFLSIEGGSVTNFELYIGPDLFSHLTTRFPSQLVDFRGFVPDTNNPTIVNGQPLCPPQANGTTNAYINPFFGGMIIGNNTNTFTPDYAQRLALAYQTGTYPYYKYHWNDYDGYPYEFSGFEFKGADGQNHFGYMDVKVNFTNVTSNSISKWIVQSVVVADCRYETTPDAGVTVPSIIKITSFTMDPANNNVITNDFGPNWANDNTNTYVLETSPTLGPSAVWVTDPNAVVSQTLIADPMNPATYQAVTKPGGNPTQFWRIRKQ
ncbi:MAG TPA: hypothetical protein VG077_18700 [Verrucomicrobiae bacterium]|nr:hypothetical protein [Verrucomicrobiae bacterium]